MRVGKPAAIFLVALVAVALARGASAETIVGNLYVADHGAIVEFSPDGAVVHTYTDPRFVQLMDLAFDNTRGVLYATDAIAHDVKVLDGSGDVVSTFGADVLAQPRGIAVHPNGDVYVADTGAGDIKVFDPAGTMLRTFGPVAVPLNLAISPDGGRLFVSESNYSTGVHVFEVDDGRYLGTFGETRANVVLTAGLAVAADGTLYVGDAAFGGRSDSIKVFNPDGSFSRTLATGLSAPVDLTLDGAGAVWVTNTNEFAGDHIISYDAQGNLSRSFGADLIQPTGLAFRLSSSPPLPDTTPPRINVPAEITVEAGDTVGTNVWYSATATDDRDRNPTVTCTPQSGSFFSVGTTTVVCEAADASGNTATASFPVHVYGPLKLELTADGKGGSVSSKTGVATITGTVACSRPIAVDLSGTLNQLFAKRVSITGSFQLHVNCTAPTTRWSANLTGDNGRFAAGPADLRVDAYGCGLSCHSASMATTVRLSGSK